MPAKSPTAAASMERIAERLSASHDPSKRKQAARIRTGILRCMTAPASHWTTCLSAICVARRALWESEGETCDGCREWTPHAHLLLVHVNLPHLPRASGPVALCDGCRQMALSLG